jgi:hypothetical protein
LSVALKAGAIACTSRGLRPLRGFKTLSGARVLCRAHAFLRNLRGGFDDLG